MTDEIEIPKEWVDAYGVTIERIRHVQEIRRYSFYSKQFDANGRLSAEVSGNGLGPKG